MLSLTKQRGCTKCGHDLSNNGIPVKKKSKVSESVKKEKYWIIRKPIPFNFDNVSGYR